MKVHCLGTTGYHPSPSRHTACYYIPDASLLLDAGSGMFALTQLLRADPRESLDIFLSHAHLDHILGLTFLLDTFAVTALKRVRVHGLGEKLKAIQEHLFAIDLFPVLPPEIEFHPLDERTNVFQLHGGPQVSWFPLEHPGGSIGCRFELSGKSLAYVTDTVARPDAAYIDQVRKVDLLLHECYFSDQYRALAEKTGHSWLSAVTEVVRLVKAKRTGLIHVNPLSEVVESQMKLEAEHLELGIFIPSDGQCICV